VTVFVIQKPHHHIPDRQYDVTPAGVYGDIEYVFDGKVQPYTDPEWAERVAFKALKNYNNYDYLLWAGGDPAGLVICSAIAADSNEGVINYLRWDRVRHRDTRETVGGQYVPVKIVV
tara:strand:- start:1024 stop:1374 length:351 start_codon:yes stop_codon:yes gene_type:complete